MAGKALRLVRFGKKTVTVETAPGLTEELIEAGKTFDFGPMLAAARARMTPRARFLSREHLFSRGGRPIRFEDDGPEVGILW